MRKVRIKRLPNKANGGTTEGINRFMQGEKKYDSGMNQFAAPEFEVNKTMSAVPEEEANIEAEGGEFAVVPGAGGIPESYKITGPRHNAGGVPLNLAEDSFIFSDHKKGMKINDREILEEFGMSVPKKGRVKGYTPAAIAKKYDLNKYKEILLNPDSDRIARETAEQMIQNNNMKLGKLALVQESMKGFPQGVPAIAMPYLQTVGIDPAQFMPEEGQQPQLSGADALPHFIPGQQQMAQGQEQMPQEMMAYGGQRTLRQAQTGFVAGVTPPSYPDTTQVFPNVNGFDTSGISDTAAQQMSAEANARQDYLAKLALAKKHGYQETGNLNVPPAAIAPEPASMQASRPIGRQPYPGPIPSFNHGGQNNQMAGRFPGLDVAQSGKGIYGGGDRDQIKAVKDQWRGADLPYLVEMAKPKTTYFGDTIPNSAYRRPSRITGPALKSEFNLLGPGGYGTGLNEAEPWFKQGINELLIEQVAKNKAGNRAQGGATGRPFDGAFWQSIMQEGGAASFQPHMMFDPETGESYMAETYQDHLDMTEQGFGHEEMRRGGTALPTYQDTGQVVLTPEQKQAAYDYANQYKQTGDLINVAGKDIDLTKRNVKRDHWAGDMSRKGYPRFGGQGTPSLDSTAAIPGIPPEVMQAYWTKSGKLLTSGPAAQDYMKGNVNFFTKGDQRYSSFAEPSTVMTNQPSPYEQAYGGSMQYAQNGKNVIGETPPYGVMAPKQVQDWQSVIEAYMMAPRKSPEQAGYNTAASNFLADPANYDLGAGRDSVASYYNPPQVVTTPQQAYGGAMQYAQDGVISEDDYQTAEDFKAGQMQFVDPDTWNTQIMSEFGNKAQRKQALFDMIKDAEAAGISEDEYENYIQKEAGALGLDPSTFINETIRDLTPEEIERISKHSPKLNRRLKKLAPTISNQFGSIPAAASFYDEQGQPKVEVETTGKATKTYNVPKTYKDNPMYKEGTPEFEANKANIKAGDYILRTDGRWEKATGLKPRELPAYAGEDMAKTFGTKQELANKYQLLEQTFADPAVREEFAKKTRAAMLDEENYKTKALDKSGKHKYVAKENRLSEDKIKGLTTDEIVQNHLNMQKRNYGFVAQGINPKEFNDNGTVKDKFKDKYAKLGIKNLNDAAKNVGVPFGKQGEDPKIGIEQGSYIGFEDLIKNRKNLPPELQTKLKVFDEPYQWGKGDEPGNAQVSPIDRYVGDTFIGQLDPLNLKGDMGFEEAEFTEPIADIPTKPLVTQPQPRAGREWYAQDIGNMANLLGQRFGIKKYMPWAPALELDTPERVLYDPARALAANAEQAGIAAQAASAFAGPQGMHRFGDIQGRGFTQAANTLADYEARNVGVENQFQREAAAIRNQQAMLNFKRAQGLYDQTTIANQQYDNSKRLANRNLFEGFRQGLTNANMAQAMNTLYPYHKTSPLLGGGLDRTGYNKPLTGVASAGAYPNTYLDRLISQGVTPSDDDKRKQAYMLTNQELQQQRQPGYSGNEKPDWMNFMTGR